MKRWPNSCAQRVLTVINEDFNGNQSAFARRVGLSRDTVAKWRSGERVPSLEALARIAGEAGRSLQWLADGTGAEEATATKPRLELADELRRHLVRNLSMPVGLFFEDDVKRVLPIAGRLLAQSLDHWKQVLPDLLESERLATIEALKEALRPHLDHPKGGKRISDYLLQLEELARSPGVRPGMQETVTLPSRTTAIEAFLVKGFRDATIDADGTVRGVTVPLDNAQENLRGLRSLRQPRNKK